MRLCVLGDFTHRKMIRYSHGERHGGLRTQQSECEGIRVSE